MAADHYRSILEVLKICVPKSVLKSFILVNKRWKEASSSNELWSDFLEDLDIPYISRLHPKLIYESAYVSQRQTVVALSCNHLHLLDIETEKWETRKLSVCLNANEYAVAVLLDGSLLRCGGMDVLVEEMRSVYRISVVGKVSVEPDLLTARKQHGVVALGWKVFVFGGVDSRSNPVLENEVFDQSFWSPLPDLSTPRHSFNPCLYQGLIYLSGGQKNTTVEVLDPEKMTLKLLSGVKIHDPVSYVATVYDSRLMIIGESEVSIWDGNHMNGALKPTYKLTGNVRPVVYKNLLYVVDGNCERTLDVVDLKTWTHKCKRDLVDLYF